MPSAKLTLVRLKSLLLTACDDLRGNMDELSELKQQKQGLRHDLLTGKIPVKADEPEVVDG